MRNLSAIALLFALGFVSCKQNPSTAQNSDKDSTQLPENMEDENGSNQKFIGSWELMSWAAESADGNIVFPFGQDAVGRITYDGNGIMAVQIMKNNRVQFTSEDPLRAEPSEKVAAYDGFIAYTGNYNVDIDSNRVIHHIKISSFPNWVGQSQVRNFAFNQNELTLSTDFIGASKHKLVWRRMHD